MNICGIAPLCLLYHFRSINQKKLTPTFILVNACIPWVYREAEKCFTHSVQN
ncbi:hypothetical protein D1AOALGA4SA_11718 [Olavius algarvensis Delta 1 endosymbiont]|nr:hypothetical protein D1AOALGA4SA_11718 [Olavius algarvensis Delta 1 endosymbiont]